MPDGIKLHHVGIAVKNLQKSQRIYETLFELHFSPTEIVESQKVKVTFARCGENRIELIQATHSRSPLFPIMEHPILSFINKNGEGFHHVCFEVPSIDSILKRLGDEGIRPLSREPQKGANSCDVVFLNPLDCNGILVEIMERHDYGE